MHIVYAAPRLSMHRTSPPGLANYFPFANHAFVLHKAPRRLDW
ncbi:hypothetical protein HDG41_000928 [Paraburkholderia sp. JPY162]|uniref:Uncharacterized protein n=1 Tax=Paraburkholderia youngii TaxID=2782701 RepID=A0A7W8L1U5_9BURK|nr:hypothetical protein [Paraburkholderia youngii]